MALGSGSRGHDTGLMSYVLHMTDLREWRRGEGDLEPPSLETQGFVHASPDDSTLLAVANAFYAGLWAPQAVLVIDTGLLDVEVRWETANPAPPPGVHPEVLFPHIYGPVRRKAVIGVRYLRREPDGSFSAVQHRGATAEELDLIPHPEGGWYRSTWRSQHTLRPEGYPGERDAASGTLFMLRPGERSRWHRLRSDEMWVFNCGGPIELTFGGTGERPVADGRVTLGPHIEAGQVVQALVPAGTWQTAHPITGREGVVSLFVSPGFAWDDFELPPDD
ncbi:cupin domain-containing protein [Nocardiopsis gilva]